MLPEGAETVWRIPADAPVMINGRVFHACRDLEVIGPSTPPIPGAVKVDTVMRGVLKLVCFCLILLLVVVMGIHFIFSR